MPRLSKESTEEFLYSIKKEYANIMRRLSLDPNLKSLAEVGQFWLQDFLVGRSVGFPSPAEIHSLYSKIKNTTPSQYYSNKKDPSAEVSKDPIEEIRKDTSRLYQACLVRYKIQHICQALHKEKDLRNLAKYYELLSQLDLNISKNNYRHYFQNSCSRSHPLSLSAFDLARAKLGKALDALANLKPVLAIIKNKIEDAENKSSLPTDEQYSELYVLVEEKFYNLGSYEILARNLIGRLENQQREKIKAIEDALLKKAVELNRAYQILSHNLSLVNMALKEFDFTKLPKLIPPNKRKKWKDSTNVYVKKCALWSMPISLNYDINDAVQKYEAQTEKLLTKANAYLSVLLYSKPIKIKESLFGLNSLISLTRQLDKKKLYEADINRYRFRLFWQAYDSYMAAQWFSCFRRSYWQQRNRSEVTFSEILHHARGGNVSYTGERTRQILMSLGWIDKYGVISGSEQWLRDLMSIDETCNPRIA